MSVNLSVIETPRLGKRWGVAGERVLSSLVTCTNHAHDRTGYSLPRGSWASLIFDILRSCWKVNISASSPPWASPSSGILYMTLSRWIMLSVWYEPVCGVSVSEKKRIPEWLMRLEAVAKCWPAVCCLLGQCLFGFNSFCSDLFKFSRS